MIHYALVFIRCVAVIAVVGGSCCLSAQEPIDSKDLRETAVVKLKEACRFYVNKISYRGGYPYFSASDGSTRWGEGELLEKAFIVQPPGTPVVGRALLQAYRATGDREYLEWAVRTGQALVEGQLRSGGWAQVVYFENPSQGRMGDYRHRGGGKWNQSSLDDNQTQSVIVFLMELDQALEFKDPAIHECVAYALDALLKAQLPHGGFPQGWRESARTFSPGSLARQKASYPDYDWKTEGRLKNYWDFATLNDGLVGDVSEVLVLASQIYQDERYLVALKRLGDFLLLAQMPDPQPGWCQQYNDNMQPIWARKFEPPAIAGVESQDAMSTLIRIAEVTQDDRYLKPVPEAIEFFRKRCMLADGRLARFYELKTNTPLYMDQDYRLTYDDSNPPAHYGWKHKPRLEQIEREYRRVSTGEAKTEKTKPIAKEKVQKVLDGLDSEGGWSHEYAGEKLMGSPKFKVGQLYVSSAEFCENVGILTDYLIASATSFSP